MSWFSIDHVVLWCLGDESYEVLYALFHVPRNMRKSLGIQTFESLSKKIIQSNDKKHQGVERKTEENAETQRYQ